jgi:hypothetical protein
MPIGMAFEAGWIESELATWRLTVHEADVPDRWIILDRVFRSVKESENPRTRS